MTSSLGALHLRLDDFEGPLPLLLHLIENNELEITRVSVAAVADQFLALMAGHGSMELATTGEFVSAAARLLLIKSRALLLRRDPATDERDELDDAEALARQIAEYARFKRVALALAERLEGDAETRARLPSPRPVALPANPAKIQAGSLLRAARRLLVEPSPSAQEAGPWSEVTFSEVKAVLLAEMNKVGQTSFGALSATVRHPLIVITMFLALLDAVRAQQLCMAQEEPFGPISVSLAGVSASHA